jgi:hypothetical protein
VQPAEAVVATAPGGNVNRVRKVTLATGIVTTVAGVSTATSDATDTPGYAAATSQPLGPLYDGEWGTGLALGPDGHFWFMEPSSYSYRIVW